MTRRETEIATLKAQNENALKESDRLKKEIEEKSLSKVGELKEKQSLMNTIKILETKLEAANGEKKFLNNKNTQL